MDRIREFHRWVVDVSAMKYHTLVCISVARISDWRGPNRKSYAMTSSEIFEKKDFLVGQRYRRMEDKIQGLSLIRNQGFAKGENLVATTVKKLPNMSNLGDMVSKL